MSITTSWIYPTNWDNSYPALSGFRRGVIHCIADDETENEENSTKVALASLKTPSGEAATRMAIDRINYDIAGYDSVKLHLDDSEGTTVAIMGPGSGEICFDRVGGKVSSAAITDDGDQSGDLLLTSSLGSGSLGSYSITVELRPKS